MDMLYKFVRQYQKYLFLLALVAFFAGGVYLRTTEYGNLLIFQSDQSRDALIIEKSLQSGFETLPLLGPQARGSSLHLGPAFYYFQYVSGKIFGTSPEVYALPDLFFGIATLGVLFFLFRRFFSEKVSLILFGLASFSLLLVTFSRFAWNPNSLPFFTSLFLLSFLMSHEKKGKERYGLLFVAAFCFGIISQLHFIALLALGLAICVFLLFYKTLSLKEIFFCMGVVLVLNTPVFIYELKTEWANTKAFFETVKSKGEEDSSHAFYEKAFRAYQDYAEINWLLLTGKQNTSTIITRGFEFKCDKRCEDALVYSLVSLLISSGIIFAAYKGWTKEKEEKIKREKAFILIWFFSFFLVSILIAYQISTRFYLGITPLFFLFFGFLYNEIKVIFQKRYLEYIVYILAVGILLANIFASLAYLKSLEESQVSYEVSSKDLVFGTDMQVTLGQLREVANDASNIFSENEPVLVSGESRYARSLYYILEREYGRKGCYIKGDSGEVSVNHISIGKAANKEKKLTQRDYGTLRIDMQMMNSNSKSILPSDCLDY